MIDNYSQHGLGVPLKNKTAQLILNDFAHITPKSARKPKLIEPDEGRESLDKFFKDFLRSKDNRR